MTTLTSPIGITILLIYVDNIIITRNDPQNITKFKDILHTSFNMKDLGRLKYFLGLEVLHIHWDDWNTFLDLRFYTFIWDDAYTTKVCSWLGVSKMNPNIYNPPRILRVGLKIIWIGSKLNPFEENSQLSPIHSPISSHFNYFY